MKLSTVTFGTWAIGGWYGEPALVGDRNRAPVLDNVKSLDFTLTKDDLQKINDKLNRLKIEK